MKKYLIFIVLLILNSCKSQKPKEFNRDTINSEVTMPSIVFYFLEAKKKGNEISIEMTQIKTVKGKLKGVFLPYTDTNNLKDTNWLVSFQNHSKNTLIQLQISNPLIEQIEYINDTNTLEKHTIYHKKKKFVIRVPYDNSINSINFESLAKENNKITAYPICKIDIK